MRDGLLLLNMCSLATTIILKGELTCQEKGTDTGRIKSQGGEKKRVISGRRAEQLKSAREEDD